MHPGLPGREYGWKITLVTNDFCIDYRGLIELVSCAGVEDWQL